jgi:hypothetical protein
MVAQGYIRRAGASVTFSGGVSPECGYGADTTTTTDFRHLAIFH